MAKRKSAGDRLFAVRWVHVFEEDTAAGAVYRPEDATIPLSRWPRERIELHRDGSARIHTAGPDDRLVEQPATWTDEQNTIVIRSPDDRVTMRVVERSKDRLIVRTGT